MDIRDRHGREGRTVQGLTVEQHLIHLREGLLPIAERCSRAMRESLAALETLRHAPIEAVERSTPLQIWPSPMNQARRCHARSKRSGKPCQALAVKGWGVCRMHGAGGGAPKGNKNALKHGRYTAEAIAMRQAINAL